MNCTRRIIKFMLVAAIALPAWHASVAQNRAVPPEEAPTPVGAKAAKAAWYKKIATETVNEPVINQANSSSADASTLSLEQRIIAEQPYKAMKLAEITTRPSQPVVTKVTKTRANVPAGYSQITITVLDTGDPGSGVWSDGTGYQMLLDADHDTYGTTIPTTGALTTSGDVPASTYALFEYKIPENADGALATENIVVSGSQSITIPAGTYDWCITNPTPTGSNARMWIAASGGDIQGRYDDYVFESGFAYTFTISYESVSDNDQLAISITSNYENPTNLAASHIHNNNATLTWTAGGDETSWNVQYRKKESSVFTWTSAGNVTSTNYLLEGLDASTSYQARVQGVYADGGLSGWALVTFTTIAADALCATDEMGEISYTLADSYGDGWNNASITIKDAQTGTVIKTLTLSSGSSAEGTVSLCYGRDVNFVWTSGSFDSECSFTITDPDGDVIVSETGSSYSNNEVITTYTMGMPVKPTNLAVNGVTYKSATATWGGVTETYNLRYRPAAGGEWVVVNNVTSPYVMTGLASETQYEVQVQGVLDGGVSNWTNSVTFTTLEGPTQSLDFGTVDAGAGSSKTMTAKIANDGNEAVQATITVNPNPPFSVASAEVTLAANTLTSIPVTFTPSEARSYTGTLTVVAGNVTTTIPLKGVGNMSGPVAVRDSSFFAGYTYDWIDSDGNSHTSRLDEVATDPDQMIAMLTEIYVNRDIPGSFKRGYSSTLDSEGYDDVYYGGVGTLTHSGTNYQTSYDYSDSYGWYIPGQIEVQRESWTVGSNTRYSYYAYMNPEEYKPKCEGLTLILVEMNDTVTQPHSLNTSISNSKDRLREYFSRVFKSVRVVTQAKRTGTGEAAGTLFNIDCDKMNKFFLMSKGEMRMTHNTYLGKSNMTSSSGSYYYMLDDACPYPCYVYSGLYYNSGYTWTTSYPVNKFFDEYVSGPFYHMFEQYSPVTNTSAEAKSDIYRSLVNMDSFGVIHDCMGVSYMGHQFMMYGPESGAADCQDVRDLMFFVPDYRMKYWTQTVGGTTTSRDNTVSDWKNYQKFMNYNQDHAPTMGLYVIIQDSVEAVTRADSYFKLKLTWDSNMDEFLPGEKQEYQLYQVIIDEFGVSKWAPVYKRNAQGQYWNPTTNAWQADTTGAERVVLTLDPSSTKKTYTEVYELRGQSSRYVTYAIRGCDTGHFLSLQMSNEESYFIPGIDPAEMALMSSATVYSRYEAQNENNCYSNKLLLKSSPRTIKAIYLPNGSTMTINRTHRVKENNQSVEVTVPIATLTVTNSGSNKYFTVSGPVLDASVKNLFPKGTEDNLTAGYHANNFTNNRIPFSTQTVGSTEYMNFDIALWDNFVADVSKNEHPGLYTYQLKFTTAESFEGLDGTPTTEAYSNIIPVFVYKTDSQINKPLTLEQVNGDTDCSDDYKPGDVEFSAQVMLSSKSEILRYDAYRWNEGAERSIVDYGGETDEDEEDYDPNGIAGNQGDAYSVTMNAIGSDDYYVGNAVPVTAEAPQNWAKFVDYYPAKLVNGGAFTYAPVVELFTRGYVEGSTTKERGDYNTYGGPLKTTAVGKIELEIPDNLNTAGNPFMSSYKWKDGNDWCTYYNIPVKFKVLGIPEGYELYKIRAWREVDPSILREIVPSRQARIASRYLFEDLTYGDALEATGSSGMTLCKADVFNKEQNYSYEVGCRPIHDADPEYNIQGETHATFGALRLNTKDGQPYSINELNATIKVRAYFTKTSNPIFSNPIYVIADNGTGWAFSEPVGTLRYDGTNFTGTVTIPESSDGSGKGYFMFSKQLGSSWTNNPKYIFGPESNGNAVVSENPSDEGYNLKYWQGGTKVLEVYPGTYTLSIGSHVQTWGESVQYDYQAGYLKISKAAAKAPTRDLTPAEYPYYVAEGEVEFTSSDYNQIITGISDLNMDGNREVMSVSYVNTIGQASSKPWQGVNIVVTRYSDGSVVTRKEVK